MPLHTELDRELFLALRRKLSKTQFENFILLMLAISIGRNHILWHLAVSVIVPISVEAAYKRLQRLLNCDAELDELKQVWVELVVRRFGTPQQRLTLFIDWTMHTDRCRSLWVQLGLGLGRSLPLCFWLHSNTFGGEGAQRAFEDQCLRQLQDWLPEGWTVRLIGDRGFGGRERMRFIQDTLGWEFLFRITGDGCVRRTTTVLTPRGRRQRVRYVRVDAEPPRPQESWEMRQVRYGRGHAVTVNLVAVCQAQTGRKQPDAVWYLATNCDADAATLACWYAGRMEIEQTFRDLKSGLGMEEEYTKSPAERLGWLLLASMVWLGRSLGRALQGRAVLESGCASARESSPESERWYRTVSDVRRGHHALLVELLLDEDSLLRQVLQEVAIKARKMSERPQVKSRRKVVPVKNRAATRGKKCRAA